MNKLLFIICFIGLNIPLYAQVTFENQSEKAVTVTYKSAKTKAFKPKAKFSLDMANIYSIAVSSSICTNSWNEQIKKEPVKKSICHSQSCSFFTAFDQLRNNATYIIEKQTPKQCWANIDNTWPPSCTLGCTLLLTEKK